MTVYNNKVNGVTHCALAFLKVNGESKADVVARYCKKLVPSCNMSRVIASSLPDMDEKDLIVFRDGLASITAAGSAELEVLESRKAAAAAAAKVEENKVPANLITPPKGTYDGAELRHHSVRTDAFDYLKCDSIINGKSVPYPFQKR